MVLVKLLYLVLRHWDSIGLLITIQEVQDDNLKRVKNQLITRFMLISQTN